MAMGSRDGLCSFTPQEFMLDPVKSPVSRRGGIQVITPLPYDFLQFQAHYLTPQSAPLSVQPVQVPTLPLR